MSKKVIKEIKLLSIYSLNTSRSNTNESNDSLKNNNNLNGSKNSIISKRTFLMLLLFLITFNFLKFIDKRLNKSIDKSKRKLLSTPEIIKELSKRNNWHLVPEVNLNELCMRNDEIGSLEKKEYLLDFMNKHLTDYDYYIRFIDVTKSYGIDINVDDFRHLGRYERNSRAFNRIISGNENWQELISQALCEIFPKRVDEINWYIYRMQGKGK